MDNISPKKFSGSISADRLSDLIGNIYDCAIEPDRWPDTIQEICGAIDCAQGVILTVDLLRSHHNFISTWGLSAELAARYLNYGEDITEAYQATYDATAVLIDEPQAFSRVVPASLYSTHRLYNEWVRPQGLCDFIQTTVLRDPGRIGVFAASRHDNVGQITDREVAIMRLLAPHIRRAVTISDVIAQKMLETNALEATLDKFAAGVMVVGGNNHILHANDAARGMFASGGPVRSVNGRLEANDARAQQELEQAVVLAQRDEVAIGATGIGVALKGSAGNPAVAHVLPLARGNLRSRLIPQASAAVFVTQAVSAAQRDLRAIAGSYGLTPAERGLFEFLAAGRTLTEAADMLNIASTTAKTHLAHIFSKTGTSRQAELIALAHRLTPPVEQPAKE
jgi:DNA-binding CsgD family transcriptional regulator